MKNISIVILLLLFGAGLYANFGMERDVEQSDLISQTSTKETEEGTSETDENTSEDETQETAADESLTFSQQPLQEAYDRTSENNEPLIIDVLLPSYYTDGFMDTLSGQFDSDTVEFNRIDVDTNTVNLSELTVSQNSDAVIMDALQIRDYNDEILPQRSVDNLTNAYMNIYNNDKNVYILGNPNAHRHENLSSVLAEEQETLTDNDYYYIDNQDVEVDGEYYDYDTGALTPEVETQIAQNIHGYIAE